MPFAPSPEAIEVVVAALVEAHGRRIAGEVILELARRFGLEIPDPDALKRALGLAASWEQCATGARKEAAQARTEIHLLDRLAMAFQQERDAARADRDALFAIGWEAIVDRNEATANRDAAEESCERMGRRIRELESAVDAGRANGHARAEASPPVASTGPARCVDERLDVAPPRAEQAPAAMPVLELMTASPVELAPVAEAVELPAAVVARDPIVAPRPGQSLRKMPPAPSQTLGGSAAGPSISSASSAPVHLRVLQLGELRSREGELRDREARRRAVRRGGRDRRG